MTHSVFDGFAMPEGVDWPKRGRKAGQRNPNSAAQDVAVQRAKDMIANGASVSDAAKAIEPDYFGHAANTKDWHQRRMKYLANKLK